MKQLKRIVLSTIAAMVIMLLIICLFSKLDFLPGLSVPAKAETYDYFIKIVDNRGGKVTATSGNNSVTVTSEAGLKIYGQDPILTVEPYDDFRLFDIRLFQNGSEIKTSGVLIKQNDNTYRLQVSISCNIEVRVTFVSDKDHNITIKNNSNNADYDLVVKRDGNVISIDKRSPIAKERDEVEIKFVPNQRYVLKEITLNPDIDSTIKHDQSTDTYTLTFTMHDYDVIVSSRYENKAYNINIASSEHGTVTANKSKPKWGESVTLNVTPENGYRLSSLKVMAGNTIITVYNNSRFEMPDSDVTITAVFEKIPEYLVVVTAKDTSDNEIEVNGNWLNKYLHGTEVTLTAPAKECYNFVGWYEGTTEKCITNSYTFTITSNVDLIARYKPLGSVSLTIDGGSYFKINGDEKSTSITADYSLGSKITVETLDDKFAYWKNSYGMILSRNKTYTFTVTGADTITAVYDSFINNKATLIFESAYGQVMARNQLASGDTMILPGLPIRNGYTALGWDLNGDDQYDSTTDTLEAAIEKGLADTYNKVTIKPVYVLKNAEYDITVTDGTGTGKYTQDVLVTVTANAPVAGNKFSHWEDENGKILCYSTTYSFFAEKNIHLTAVYVADTTVVEAVGTTEIINMYKEGNNLIFVSMSTVPEGCTIKKAGAIATDNPSIGTSADEFKDDKNVYVLGDAWSGKAYRYTLTITNTDENKTWYVRAYLLYTDRDGNTHKVYGTIVNQ